MSGGTIEMLEKLDTLTPSLQRITDGSMKKPASELCPVKENYKYCFIHACSCELDLSQL